MKDAKHRRINRFRSKVSFIGFICWLFMAIGVAFFQYDPGVFVQSITFLLAAAYFYFLYEKFNKAAREIDDFRTPKRKRDTL